LKLPDNLQSAIDETRARVRFRFPWWLRLFLLRNVAAITLGRRIYFAPNLSREKVERFLRHELVHVRQIARLGLVRFYWRYLLEYLRLRRQGLRHFDAYRNISFEIEALAAEQDPYNRPDRPER
jgi:hypothetical protein